MIFIRIAQANYSQKSSAFSTGRKFAVSKATFAPANSRGYTGIQSAPGLMEQVTKGGDATVGRCRRKVRNEAEAS